MFYELIQSQTEKVMLAEVRPQYVFKVIDPAIPPEHRSKPNRWFICLLGILCGGFLSVAGVLMSHYLLLRFTTES